MQPAPSTNKPPPEAGSNPNNTDQQSISFDKNYFKSPIGIISVLATIHAFIAIIVMAVPGHSIPYLRGAFLLFILVAVASFLVSAVTIFIGITQCPKHYPTLPVMMVVCFAIMAVLNLVASSLVAARAILARDGACAVLGFLLFQAYVACICLNLPEAIQYFKRLQPTERVPERVQTPANVHVETPPIGSPDDPPPSQKTHFDNLTYG